MRLFVDKDTDLMRSTFIAAGLAELLYYIPPTNSGQQVTIKDMGSCYIISSTLSFDALTQYVEQRGLPSLLPAITKSLTASEKKLVEGGQPVEDILLKYIPHGYTGKIVKYVDHKAAFDIWRKYRPAKGAVHEEGAPNPPDADFPVWAHLCSYFGKGSAMRAGYPTVLHNWHAHVADHKAAVHLWQLIYNCYGVFPNEVDHAQAVWNEHFLNELQYPDYPLATTISTLAIVSPSTSKGISAASGYNLLTEDTPNTFWLEMYFAFVGFLQIAMPFTLDRDVLTFYPLPDDIQRQPLRDLIEAWRDSANVRSLYRHSNNMPRAKLDVLGQITFYQSMVEYFISGYNDGTLLPGMSLNNVSGLVGYYYKDISTQIPFDETVFSVPPWLHQQPDIDLLETAEGVLKAHYELLDAIRGRPPKYQMTADEMLLINLYRRYLTRGNADDWIDFAIACGQYRFRNMTEMGRLPTLTIELFEESFPMQSNSSDRVDYRPILNDNGFKQIAEAISYCTSYSRYMRDVRKDRTFPFRPRHGLGDDLLRNAHNPELFLEELSLFVHDYRRESISVQAQTRQTRTEITPDDLNSVVELVAIYGSRIVAHLLVASGYAARFGSSRSSENTQ